MTSPGQGAAVPTIAPPPPAVPAAPPAATHAPTAIAGAAAQPQNVSTGPTPAGPASAPAAQPLKVFEQFVAALVSVYGDSQELKDYARGLYTCRSIHEHGLSDFEPEETKKYRHQAYVSFLSRRGNYSICRAVCRDVVLRQLWGQPGGFRKPLERALGYRDSADDLLQKFFHSEKAWHAIRARVKEQGAGRKIGALTGEELASFRSDVLAFVEGFDWQVVNGVDKKDVKNVVKTMLIANANSTKDVPAEPGAPPMEALGTAYDDPEDPEKEISIWAMEHERHLFDVRGGDRTDLIIAAAWKAASFFAQH